MDIKRVSTTSQFVDLKTKGAKGKKSTSENSIDTQKDSIAIGIPTSGNTPHIDYGRVEELKAKIKDGSYEFNLEGIAKAIRDLDE